jgi:hypothetical protein
VDDPTERRTSSGDVGELAASDGVRGAPGSADLGEAAGNN